MMSLSSCKSVQPAAQVRTMWLTVVRTMRAAVSASKPRFRNCVRSSGNVAHGHSSVGAQLCRSDGGLTLMVAKSPVRLLRAICALQGPLRLATRSKWGCALKGWVMLCSSSDTTSAAGMAMA